MTPARQRLVAFATLAVLAGALLLASSQPWFAFTVRGQQLEAGGDRAAGALAPLGLAVLALIAALALAGPVLRTLLGVLAALLGLAAIAVAVVALADPVRAVAPLVAERTGVAGDSGASALVEGLTVTAWPGAAIVTGALLVFAAAWIALTARRWPSSGRRYSRTRVAGEAGTAVDAWDALSAGEDPTGDARAARLAEPADFREPPDSRRSQT